MNKYLPAVLHPFGMGDITLSGHYFIVGSLVQYAYISLMRYTTFLKWNFFKVNVNPPDECSHAA